MPTRVLVTGFNDWKGVNGELFKCEENPSGLLVCGDLKRALGEVDGVEWRFLRLPVVWGASGLIDYDSYDVVVNLGLHSTLEKGVLNLENGAMNLRRGPDVVGKIASEQIAEGSRVLQVPTMSAIVQSTSDMKLPHDYTVKVATADPSNNYICNETHFGTLTAVASGRLTAGFFIHIPQAPLPELCSALAALITHLVVQIGTRGE
eukprot:TRINITY_DN17037_c0_g1_i1.p1 TRINITY_DN17037_c0_g1~~TRINITY_DN17037_c0_g1_i1.p1  ORF type:complete len:219 (+),score=53.85 TRINITY_DN17037_c0_g1_i1:43-657(+)